MDEAADFPWDDDLGTIALSEAQVGRINASCADLLHALWPEAKPEQIDRGVEAIKPFRVEVATTGNIDEAKVEEIGHQLRE
jgi:hypothetical protein